MITIIMKIFLTGHKGLVGSAILRKLKEKNFKNIITVDRKKLDLLDQKSVYNFLKKKKPDLVINAAGRVGEAVLGARLLSCDDEIYAMNTSNLLDEQNKVRQEIESSVLEQALSFLNEENENENVIVVAADNWHPGVIGIQDSLSVLATGS